MKTKGIAIYELTPMPFEDEYRLVETFENWEDATTVLKALESVNINFNLYKLVDMDAPIKCKETV